VEVFHERVRDTLGADPRRLFHEGPVEGEHFFKLGRNRVIDGGAGKVGERDNGFVPMLGDRGPHKLEQELHLLGIGMREVKQQNLLAVVLNEMYAIVHSRTLS